MDIEFTLERKEGFFFMIKIVQINTRQHAHRVRIENPADLDNQLLSWLEEAFRSKGNI